MDGCPRKAFELSFIRVRGMRQSFLPAYHLSIPAHPELGKFGHNTNRAVYVAQMIRNFCFDYPGIGVVLRRCGGGSSECPAWVREIMVDEVPFSHSICGGQLDCVTASVVEAVQFTVGTAAATKVAGADGVGYLKSLRAVRDMIRNVSCEVRKLPKEANSAIQSHRTNVGLEWFVRTTTQTVYIVRLKKPHGDDNSVLVDTISGVVIDKDKSRVMRLCTAALWACDGEGPGVPYVIQGRSIYATSKSNKREMTLAEDLVPKKKRRRRRRKNSSGTAPPQNGM